MPPDATPVQGATISKTRACRQTLLPGWKAFKRSGFGVWGSGLRFCDLPRRAAHLKGGGRRSRKLEEQEKDVGGLDFGWRTVHEALQASHPALHGQLGFGNGQVRVLRSEVCT